MVIAFLEDRIRYHGKPLKIQTDNGSCFRDAFRSWAEEQGIEVIHGRALHPQSQGAVEKKNKDSKSKLSKILHELQKHGSSWGEYLGPVHECHLVWSYQDGAR